MPAIAPRLDECDVDCLHRRHTIRAMSMQLAAVPFGPAAHGAARRRRRSEGRRPARARHHRRAHELRGRRRPPPARHGHSRGRDHAGHRRRRSDLPHPLPTGRAARVTAPGGSGAPPRLDAGARRHGALDPRARTRTVRGGRRPPGHRAGARRGVPRAVALRRRRARRARTHEQRARDVVRIVGAGASVARRILVRRSRPRARRDRRGRCRLARAGRDRRGGRPPPPGPHRRRRHAGAQALQQPAA